MRLLEDIYSRYFLQEMLFRIFSHRRVGSVVYMYFWCCEQYFIHTAIFEESWFMVQLEGAAVNNEN